MLLVVVSTVTRIQNIGNVAIGNVLSDMTMTTLYGLSEATGDFLLDFLTCRS